MDKGIIQKVIDLRRELHQHPELSGMEYWTARRIVRFLTEYPPDRIYDKVGGEGIIARYDLHYSDFSDPLSYYSMIAAECINHKLKENKSTSSINILYRCELDALPIIEESDLPYQSVNPGVAHLCGHDGHIALMCGFGAELYGLKKKSESNEIKDGKVSIFLLYQPAEETGEGAEKVAEEFKKMEITFDYSFAFHNKPGDHLGEVTILEGTYACASVGIEIILTGETSHASEPEHGISPAFAIAKIIEYSDYFIKNTPNDRLATIVYINMGEKAYGSSPGTASVGMTIRAINDDDLTLFRSETEGFIRQLGENYRLKTDIIYHDYFPATINNTITNEIARKAAIRKGIKISETNNGANRGSDDFAHLTLNTKASFIDIGAGCEHPALHEANFDFPDELIDLTLNLL